jgi:hypothetical protein
MTMKTITQMTMQTLTQTTTLGCRQWMIMQTAMPRKWKQFLELWKQKWGEEEVFGAVKEVLGATKEVKSKKIKIKFFACAVIGAVALYRNLVKQSALCITHIS